MMCSNILEQSCREIVTEAPLNPGFAAGARLNIGPCSVQQNPPTDMPNTETDDSSTRLLGTSQPQYSAIGVPVPADGQTIGPEEREVDESGANGCCVDGCCTFLNWYKNTVVNFRNSCYIHIVNILFSYIPISAIILGLMFLHECPQISYLPVFVTVVGFVGVKCMGLWIVMSCYAHRDNTFSNLLKCVIGMIFMVLLITLALEMYLVGQLSPSFDPSSDDYCNKTFYYYVIGKVKVSAAAIILAVLLYFPGSSLHTCCQDCSMPSPRALFSTNLNA